MIFSPKLKKRVFPNHGGQSLMDSSRIQLKSAKVKVNGITEALLVSESTSPCLYGLDPAVDAFRMTVVSFQDDGVNNAPQVFLQRCRDFLHGRQAAANHPVDQSLPALQCPGPVLVMPQLRRKLLHRPGASRFQAGLSQQGEGSTLVPTHVGWIPQPLVFGAFQLLVTRLEQLTVFVTTYLINAFAQILGYMKAVEGNLAIGIFNGLARRLDVGRPHIHANHVDTAELSCVKLLVEAAETGGQAVFRDVHNTTGFLIGHYRDVIVALAIGGLVNTQSLRCQGLAARQTALHRSLHYAIDGVPAQSQALCHRADGRRFEPVDHQSFKQRREAAARLCPRHLNGDDAMLLTFHSGDVCHQHCLQLAGIQVPPATGPLVVARASLSTLRTGELAAAMLHLYLYLIVFKRHVHRGNLPRLLDAENLTVKLCIFHDDKANLPTQFGEDPKKLLRCETLGDCQRIQSGNLHLRRLGKWSILFTIAFTLLINDLVAMAIDSAMEVSRAADEFNSSVNSSVLFRWTVGWLLPVDIPVVPVVDPKIFVIYNVLNFVQFLIFMAFSVYAIRWVYADCRVNESRYFTFQSIMALALVTNLVLYFSVKWMINF